MENESNKQQLYSQETLFVCHSLRKWAIDETSNITLFRKPSGTNFNNEFLKLGD